MSESIPQSLVMEFPYYTHSMIACKILTVCAQVYLSAGLFFYAYIKNPSPTPEKSRWTNTTGPKTHQLRYLTPKTHLKTATPKHRPPRHNKCENEDNIKINPGQKVHVCVPGANENPYPKNSPNTKWEKN